MAFHGLRQPLVYARIGSNRVDSVPKPNTSGLKPFKPGQSGNPHGRPVGSISLSQRIQSLLEGDQLPQSLKDTIKAQCGSDKKAIDAMIMVGMLQALQGDAAWFKAVMEHGYGKPTQKNELSGPDGGAIAMSVEVKFGK